MRRKVILEPSKPTLRHVDAQISFYLYIGIPQYLFLDNAHVVSENLVH